MDDNDSTTTEEATRLKDQLLESIRPQPGEYQVQDTPDTPSEPSTPDSPTNDEPTVDTDTRGVELRNATPADDGNLVVIRANTGRDSSLPDGRESRLDVRGDDRETGHVATSLTPPATGPCLNQPLEGHPASSSSLREVHTEGESIVGTDQETDTTPDNQSETEGEETPGTPTLTEEEMVWNQYLDLAELPRPPNRIPREHVKDFIAAVERCSNTFLRTKSVRALFDIMRLPKTVFDPHLTRRRTALIRTALRDYPQVELPDPKAPERRPRQPRPPDPNADIKRAERLFQDGYLRKALQCLVSKRKPVPITPEIFQRLRELHPQQEADQGLVTYTEKPDKPDTEDIFNTMKKVNLEASGGPSGWNYRHVKVALRSPAFVDFITTYVGMMAEGTAPGRDIMVTSSGLVLGERITEGTVTKIRPISMPEPLFQIGEMTSNRKNRQKGDLMTTQLGSGTPGGVEPLIWIKNKHLKSEETGDGLEEIDRKNAFNTMKLENVRKGLAKWNPKNGPLFEWTYRSSAVTLVQAEDGQWIIMRTTCLLQGRKASGFYFQIGDRVKLEELQQQLGESSTVWSYMDDLTILKDNLGMDGDCDTSPPLLIAHDVLGTDSINTTKSKSITSTQVQQHGYETLGGCIGPPEKRSAFIKKQIDDIQHKVVQIRKLRKQTQLVLLRQCIIPTMNHTMRTTDPTGCEERYQQLKTVIINAVAELAGVPVQLGYRDRRRNYMPRRDGGRVRDTDLISLPTRYGGLGLTDPIAQSKIAWEASQAKSEFLVRKWVMGTIQRGQQRMPSQQKTEMEKYWKKSSDQLMEKLYRDRCLRIATNSEKSASAWLTTIPNMKVLQLTDNQVAAGLRRRLLKEPDHYDIIRSGRMNQEIIKAFKEAEYDATLVTTNTNYQHSDGPDTRAPGAVVEPMAISVMKLRVDNINVTTTNNQEGLLSHYKKEIHAYASRRQDSTFNARQYTGKTHFPLIISPTGAFLGKTRKYITEMKQRSVLNRLPSPITQIISCIAVRSLKIFDPNRRRTNRI